jgi:hypothetical protein
MEWKKLSRRQAVKTIWSAALVPLVDFHRTGNLLAASSRSNFSATSSPQDGHQRISLNQSTILVDANEPSYVQFAVRDLADYIKEITGIAVPVRKEDESANSVIVVGERAARRVMARIPLGGNPGDDRFFIESGVGHDKTQVIVAGPNPKGTNFGIAAFMKMIRVEENSAYLVGPLRLHSKPSFNVRGIHLNGWPFNSPYSFRDWREGDWQQFIDMVWLQGANLFFLWPFMEIIPVPLSNEDEAYLQEVRRVVDYAQKQRGMEVWIMHAANRVAISDCGVRDPRKRPYWVTKCQVDMNPADPQQFKKIIASLEVLYRIVNNANGFGMIDSDPGGWPQSPLSDQLKIFRSARKLLDSYNEHKDQAILIDWMWIGWGRHKYFNATHTAVAAYDWTSRNPDSSDVAFMEKTIRTFKKGLPEPWSLIAGFAPYLQSSREEEGLGKTVFLPYGAIEGEPSFPWTNVPLSPVRRVLDVLANYPDTEGLMGNNQTPLLQLPRTYYFLSSAWNYNYRTQKEEDVLFDLAGHLYPEHRRLMVDCYLALDEVNPQKINLSLNHLEGLVSHGNMGRLGVIGRKVFPDHLEIAKKLVFQLKIRLGRQTFLQALQKGSSRDYCEKLLGDYLDSLLSWDEETGWQRMTKIGIWRRPIYKEGTDFRQSLSTLKRIIGEGAPVTSYGNIDRFFEVISERLTQKYDKDVVMDTCIEPLKLAVIQAP